MSTVTATTPVTTIFPKSAVEACLRDELIEAVKSEAFVKGIPLPSDLTQLSKAPVPVDSLVVVTILYNLEPIVGFLLPHTVVRSGGYSSVASALNSLLPKIEDEWNSNKGV